MNGNDIVRVVLRSPLHVFMGDTMLITVTGRKTGRRISLPVNFYRDGLNLWVISSRNRTWWRNLVHGAVVTILVHGRQFSGYGDAILDQETVAACLGDHVRHVPTFARYLGLRMENGVPNCDDVERFARERLFVRVCLET